MKWQTIDTAPITGEVIGKRILVFCPPYGAGSANWTGERWNCHFCLNKEAQPTHWMPLPEPPKDGE